MNDILADVLERLEMSQIRARPGRNSASARSPRALGVQLLPHEVKSCYIFNACIEHMSEYLLM